MRKIEHPAVVTAQSSDDNYTFITKILYRTVEPVEMGRESFELLVRKLYTCRPL